MNRLDGKVVLITGGARGQGAEEGRLFAAEGATVVLSDVRDEEGEAVARRIGDAATFVHHDVTSEEEWDGVVKQVLDAHGRLDVLINNAGIYRRKDLLELPLEEYRQMIEINQVGVFLGLRAAGRAMRDASPARGQTASGTRSIVNISSTAGMRGAAGSIAYSASKWAVRGMTKVAARELGPLGIRVNSIHPGPIDTDMIREQGLAERRDEVIAGLPLRRLGEAADVANLALFLASDESAFCTGAEYLVDGGSVA
ncbi:MAG: glucose 1-dehydrogenase [Chloroflexi bacterium]|nr:glucose 1-dehydrogenase [Chloroflexota bacterium]